MNYYNEWNAYKAQFIRNAIDAGEIPFGHVDTRSIVDVTPGDVAGYTQCHFFCGVAGWSLAARMAGWPDERGLWSGSPPCQSYSVAGLQRGMDDPRDLWPHYYRLIAACRPDDVVGEQVTAAIGFGWIDRVYADLDRINYARRAVSIPACAVDAPHRRERIFFVAHSNAQRAQVPLDGHVAAIQVARSHLHSHWQGATALACCDGRTRRHEPTIPLLVDGLPLAMAASCAYGDAIVPQVGAAVLSTYMECYP